MFFTIYSRSFETYELTSKWRWTKIEANSGVLVSKDGLEALYRVTEEKIGAGGRERREKIEIRTIGTPNASRAEALSFQTIIKLLQTLQPMVEDISSEHLQELHDVEDGNSNMMPSA